MRPANILIPVVIAFFAVSAFLLVMNFAIPAKEKNANTTNTTTNTVTNTATNTVTNTTANSNTSVNTNTSTDATKDWKTYTNDQVEYSFKYPTNWTVSVTGTDKKIINIAPTGSTEYMVIYYRNVSADQYISDLGSQVTIVKQEDYTLGDKASKKLTINAPVRGQSTYFITGLGANCLSILDANGDTNLQILSTLEFTNPTADWKTYTNSTHGYSLKYPANYTITPQSTDDNVYWTNAAGASVLDVKYRLDSADGSLSTWYDTASVADAILGGVSGKQFVYKYCDGPSCGHDTVAIAVKHQSKLLGLEFVGDRTLDSTENLILSAFIFADPTAGWKTYTSTKYNFTFKYPADWSLVVGAYKASEALSSDYVWVKDPTNDDISFEVCPDLHGGDCLPAQDAEWDSATSNVTVDGMAGVKTTYTLASGQTCPTCTPHSTITLNQRPTGWDGGRDFLIRPGANNSTVPDVILSTITLTK